MLSPLTEDKKKAQVVVVMVPLPAQGHLNQLLHLSRLISAYDIPVHYVGTTTHSRQAKSRVQGFDLSATNIHFHEFPTPPFPTPPPNPSNASNKFPTHLLPSFEASLRLREPVGALLNDLAPNVLRVVVIYDTLMASVVQDAVTIPNAEVYAFQSASAFFYFWMLWEDTGRPFLVEDEILKELPANDGIFSPEFVEFINALRVHQFSAGTIHNVSKVIEAKYFDLLKKEEIGGNTNQWALGPFNPVSISDYYNSSSSNQRHECLKWLDKQAPSSVIFVSFGTTTSFTDEQIHELAIGLEDSEQRFIWVLREADKGDIFEGNDYVRRAELPKGYEDRIEGKGIIVRDWAPQLEILGHPSTGGFMSHCGWNSCMESMSMGVAIAAWPMHSDQPSNAMLVTKVLKIGTSVKDWARRDKLVTSLTVKQAVRKLLASKEGDDIRKRAAELGGAVRRSVAEGGVTRAEFDSFITHITRM